MVFILTKGGAAYASIIWLYLGVFSAFVLYQLISIESYPTSSLLIQDPESCEKKWLSIELGYDSPVTSQPLAEKRIDLINSIVYSAHPKRHGRKAYLASYCQLTRYKVDDFLNGINFDKISDLDLLKLLVLPGFNELLLKKLLISFNRNPESEPFRSALSFFHNQKASHCYVYHEPDLMVMFPGFYKNE